MPISRRLRIIFALQALQPHAPITLAGPTWSHPQGTPK